MLTEASQIQVIAHLRESAQEAYRVVQDRDGVFSQWFTGGSSAGGQRTAIRVVLDVTVPTLERLAPSARESDAAEITWRELATDAEDTLRAVEGYSYESSVRGILVSTAKATGDQVRDGVNTVAETVATGVVSAIPWWVYLVAAGAAVLALRRGLS